MSAKNLDAKGRFRSVTVGFRVSPEEGDLLDRMVALESKLQVIQAQAEATHDWFSRIRESIGWLVTTASAIYAAFLHAS